MENTNQKTVKTGAEELVNRTPKKISGAALFRLRNRACPGSKKFVNNCVEDECPECGHCENECECSEEVN